MSSLFRDASGFPARAAWSSERLPGRGVIGSINTEGVYNHFSALRSYEDLLGLTDGGDDGHGHLGYAATSGLLPFGKDVFNH